MKTKRILVQRGESQVQGQHRSCISEHKNKRKQYNLPKVSIHIMQKISLVNKYVPCITRMLTHLHSNTQGLCGCVQGHMILCVCLWLSITPQQWLLGDSYTTFFLTWTSFSPWNYIRVLWKHSDIWKQSMCLFAVIVSIFHVWTSIINVS